MDETILGHVIQLDRSGQGHDWRPIARGDIPAAVIEEIEGEIIDGRKSSCDDYLASNGQHYRWRA
jgi:hypothetical protein